MTIAPVIVKKVEQNEDTQQMACANSISLCNPAMIKLNTSLKQDNSEIYVYITPEGEKIGYHIDKNGRPYRYNEYTGEKSELLLHIPSDVFGTVMTSPYVYSTTEPQVSETDSTAPSTETGGSVSNS